MNIGLEIRRMNPVRHRGYKGLLACFAVALFLQGAPAQAEDGYRLWLRYDSLPRNTIDAYRPHVTSLAVQGNSPTFEAIRTELVNGCSGLLGGPVPLAK